MADNLNPNEQIEGWVPTAKELSAIEDVFSCYTDGRSTIEKNYNQFNGRSLQECIDDWEKRWNGWIPASDALVDTQSMIFLNFTRNAIISYISKSSMQPAKVKVAAVNNKSGLVDKAFSQFCEDIVKYSSDAENGDSRLLEVNLERTIKGTAIVYEGYKRITQDMKIPDGFDMESGQGKFKKEKRVVFDNCFQRLVKANHFMIKNPYLPANRLQEQPWVLEEEITTLSEAKATYGKYKNFRHVKGGDCTPAQVPTTFYENTLITDLKKDQVQILKLFKRHKNIHRIMINGVIVYDGPIPYKDGMYPYAAYIFEPFGNDFFWGAGFPNKIQGEQDSINTQFNTMSDKQINSLLPTGLSSDLDDLIEDEVIEMGKFRKVGDINKWKFMEYPDISQAESNFLQTTLGFARQNSGDVDGVASASTPRGGKVTARQILLKQQEAMQRMEFSMNYLEDGERDRTILRLNHCLQFYSIPKLEKVTGKKGEDMNKLIYRDITLSQVDLSDGKDGNRFIDLVNSDSIKTPDDLQKLQDSLSVKEAIGEQMGVPTEALAVNVDSFYDYNLQVLVVKNSSFSRNQALDQAMKHEYADWLLGLTQFGLQVDVPKLAQWVGEAYDTDTEDFIQQSGPPQQPGQPAQGQDPNAAAGGGAPTPQTTQMGNKNMKQPALNDMGA